MVYCNTVTVCNYTVQLYCLITLYNVYDIYKVVLEIKINLLQNQPLCK